MASRLAADAWRIGCEGLVDSSWNETNDKERINYFMHYKSDKICRILLVVRRRHRA